MVADNNGVITLARRLRELRETTWRDHELTQAQLAKAFSAEEPVKSATVSSWESATSPKTPAVSRINAYARFFCTRRSLEGEPHLIPEDQLTSAELDAFRELQSELLELFQPQGRKLQRIFGFDEGPVILVCPTAPEKMRGPLAGEQHANFTKLHQYADLDALIELYGYLRAENPKLDVFHRLTNDVKKGDFSSHVILLGGIGWNKVTRRFQSAISQVPITQTVVDDVKTGEIFRVDTSDDAEPKLFYPKFEDLGDGDELIEDVGYLARLRNPFKDSRTLTICNGIHSRGVLGAVYCLTDPEVREENEKYLAERFPEGQFAVLLRVLVVANETLSPELQSTNSVLYEWPLDRDDRR